MDLTLDKKKIVAIVDDDSQVRRALKDLLSVHGYAAIAFDSAEAFLCAARTSNADCLLVDIQLGDISGIELGRQLLETGLKLPIIFMTAASDDVTRDHAMKLGCVAYLHKPFRSQLLVEAIGKATG